MRPLVRPPAETWGENLGRNRAVREEGYLGILGNDRMGTRSVRMVRDVRQPGGVGEGIENELIDLMNQFRLIDLMNQFRWWDRSTVVDDTILKFRHCRKAFTHV